MTSNIVLDVAISLVFIFLLYSLMATILMELLAWLLDLRAKMLTKTIRVMLEDRLLLSEKYENWLIRIFVNPIDRFFTAFFGSVRYVFCPFPKRSLAKAFYKHPSIKYLSESVWNNKPSYICPSTFAETLIKLLRGSSFDGSLPVMDAIGHTLLAAQPKIDIGEREEAVIDPHTLYQIRQIYYDAKGDSSRFQQLLEAWYEEVSARASGWYKKQTQFYLLLMGFFIAWQFNVDTLSIYKIVAKDDKARDAIVTIATKAPEKLRPVVDKIKSDAAVKDNNDKNQDTYLSKTYKDLQADADNANLVLGMGKPFKDSLNSNAEKLVAKPSKITPKERARLLKEQAKYQKEICNWKYSEKQIGGQLNTIIGWFITALAISLGAPFWFDLLNKLVQLRNAGKKPEDTASTVSSPNGKQDVPSKNRVG